MGLMSWIAPKKTIDLPGGDSFTVRGLSIDDITALWSIFGEELFSVFQGLEHLATDDESKNIVLEASLMAWLGNMVVEFPEIIASLIAVASDEKGEIPDIARQVATIPLPVQLEALITIYQMTVTEAGGSKKLVGHLSTVTAVVASLMPMAGKLGIGDSGNPPTS